MWWREERRDERSESVMVSVVWVWEMWDGVVEVWGGLGWQRWWFVIVVLVMLVREFSQSRI